jgi:hypothetical protein
MTHEFTLNGKTWRLCLVSKAPRAPWHLLLKEGGKEKAIDLGTSSKSKAEEKARRILMNRPIPRKIGKVSGTKTIYGLSIEEGQLDVLAAALQASIKAASTLEKSYSSLGESYRTLVDAESKLLEQINKLRKNQNGSGPIHKP